MLIRNVRKKISAISFVALLSIFIIINFTAQANANMFGFLKKYDVHLSPVVEGKVLFDGKPLIEQKIIRSLTYGDDEEQIETVTSDHDGSFHFPEKNIRSRRPGSMFDESTVRQIILIKKNNKEYLLWYSNTLDIKPAQAISKRLLSLQCDLDNSEKAFEFPSIEHPKLNHFTDSICRW